jgi:general secretion pathway protein J
MCWKRRRCGVKLRRQRLARRATASSAGFTLLEALFATVLMAIILGTIATVTAQWLPGWDRGFVRLHRAESLDVGLERLVADLSAAQVMFAGQESAVFDGSELSVTFVRTTLGPNTVTGLEVVRIAEMSDQGRTALVRTTAPFVPLIPDVTGLNFSNPVVLIRAPYRVSFSYAGYDRIWHDNWRLLPQIPRAIRVRVRDAATMQTLAVSTSTPVYAELSASCVAYRVKLDQVQKTMGRNDGANAAFLKDCFGPPSSTGAGSGTGAASAQAQ